MEAIRLQTAAHLDTCGSEIPRHKVSDILCNVAFPQPIPARAGVGIPVRRMTRIQKHTHHDSSFDFGTSAYGMRSPSRSKNTSSAFPSLH